MTILLKLAAAVCCLVLVVAAALCITKLAPPDSILQKNYCKMSLSYFLGIFVFLTLIRMIYL